MWADDDAQQVEPAKVVSVISLSDRPQSVEPANVTDPNYADADRVIDAWWADHSWRNSKRSALTAFVHSVLDSERDKWVGRLTSELAEALGKVATRDAAIEMGENTYQRAIDELAAKTAECERLLDVVRDLRDAEEVIRADIHDATQAALAQAEAERDRAVALVRKWRVTYGDDVGDQPLNGSSDALLTDYNAKKGGAT